ncbi:MAG: hypothetical protein A4E66_00846 [Syntrophus sp. PtaB.Bin001]|nr:MAG: hypothetical protein A4E66_00846 [Syntrophus sp. PtaB.Bin001]
MNNLTLYDESVWNHFVKPGEVVEIRVLGASGKLAGQSVYRKTVSGCFDNHPDFCKAMKQVDGLEYSGAYFTLQVIDPRLIGRAFNRLKVSDLTTSDNNVLAYRWLPLDFDPVRPSGISSSDAELKEAVTLRDHVIPIIQKRYDLPSPLLAMSGNGCHALFRLPDWSVDDEHKRIMQGLLKAISEEFNTKNVNIDAAVWNPARIWKLYGTTAHKGDIVPAGGYREARPHRESYIESLGE